MSPTAPRKLSPTAIAMFEKLKRRLRREALAIERGADSYTMAHAFDMSTWIRPRNYGGNEGLAQLFENTNKSTAILPQEACNTVGCIAGTCALWGGYRPVVKRHSYRYGDDQVAYDYTIDHEQVALPGHNKVSVSTAARRVLGIQHAAFDQACNLLFTPWWGPGLSTPQYDGRPSFEGNPYWEGLSPANRRDVIKAITRFMRAHR